MQLNPFSFILIFIIIYILFFKYKNLSWEKALKELFTLTLILRLNLNYGYFIGFGDIKITYNAALAAFFGSVAVIYIMHYRLNRTILKYGALFVLCSVAGLVCELIIPYGEPVIEKLNQWDGLFSGQNLRAHINITISTLYPLMKFIFCIMILAAARKLFRTFDAVYELVNKIVNYGMINIIYGYVEFIAKNFFNFDTSQRILTPFFGLNVSTYKTLSKRGTYYMLQGVFRETSHFSYSLFLTTLFNIAYMYFLPLKFTGQELSHRAKFQKYRIISAVLVMALSFSFSIFLFWGTFVIVYMFAVPKESKPQNLAIKIIFAVILSLAAASILSLTMDMSYYIYRIELLLQAFANIFRNGIEFFGNHSSPLVRFASMLHCMKYFLARPLFGLGTGTTDCHSMVGAILANCGFIGAVLWLKTVMAFSRTETGIVNTAFIITIIFPLFFFGSLGDATSLLYPLLILAYSYILTSPE